MDDQFIEKVKKFREQKLSERKIAEQLKVPRNQVRDALQSIKQAEAGKALVPEERMREIIHEELKLARDSEGEDEKADGRFPVRGDATYDGALDRDSAIERVQNGESPARVVTDAEDRDYMDIEGEPGAKVISVSDGVVQ